MSVRRAMFSASICIGLFLMMVWLVNAQQPPQGRAAASVPLYNTAKQKLAEGRQIVGGTVSSKDPNIVRAMATAGFDFLWIEMQHSVLSYETVADLVWASRGSPAIPMIRVPDATEGDIQKATDLGALGIIIPMVDTVEKAQAAVRFTKFPPAGRRSSGGGQAGALWGSTYRQTANDNILVVAMIESPEGVKAADQIAAVPGIDVVFAASNDLGSFSGFRQGDPRYETLVTQIHDATVKAGKWLGGPQAWKTTRQGFVFFQGPGETNLIRTGAQVSLGTAPVESGQPGQDPR